MHTYQVTLVAEMEAGTDYVMVDADDFEITKGGGLIFYVGRERTKKFGVAPDLWELVVLLEDKELEALQRQQDHREMACKRAEEGVMSPGEATPISDQ